MDKTVRDDIATWLTMIDEQLELVAKEFNEGKRESVEANLFGAREKLQKVRILAAKISN
jgi:hypothetical protein